jgi:hypothetical protein
MSYFELKYVKEVLENLKLIKENMSYKYKIENIIEELIELIEEYE